MSYHNRLSARVKAVNRSNALAIKYHAILSAAFAPFVGQKILKVDGSLLEKVKAALPALPYRDNTPEDGNGQVYLHRVSYGVVYVAKVSEMVDEVSCTYSETSIFIGNVDGMNLTTLSECVPYRTDFTVQEILDKRAAYQEASAAARKAESALGVFGHYDN